MVPVQEILLLCFCVFSAILYLQVRCFQVHGDYSAETKEPFEDFAAGGPTREQWNFIRRTGPLTSRTVCSEAGGVHLVQDPLGQDARMVPLLRAIASEKDGDTKGRGKDFNVFLAPPKKQL